MKLGPALILTPDLDVALAFYGDALGLPLDHSSPDQLVFDVAGAPLHVFRCAHPAPGVRHGEDAATVVTFEVDDLTAEMARLRVAGVRFLHETPAHNAPAGLAYAAFVAPGGNVHELVERQASPPRRSEHVD